MTPWIRTNWRVFAGLAVFVAVWWILADTVYRESRAVPSPGAIIAAFVRDGPLFYLRNVGDTVLAAGQGYLWGNLAALALAAVALLLPWTHRVIEQIGVISHCLPLTAVGPVILVIFGGRTTSIFLAALLVFFTTLIGALLGVRSAPRTALDLVSAYRGGRWAKIVKVQAIAAVPATITALQVGVPAAILGAVLGEYLGGVTTGLGVALAVAQRQMDVERAWAFAVTSGLVTIIGYALIAALGRWLMPLVVGRPRANRRRARVEVARSTGGVV
ncbi:MULTISPECIES: ABC transporter permease [unclassified Rathayibacter]|uniref:ABC transporter permease n=1 Tax=unclassified Rathayibacter TaxID=2609250 RepID=UPI001FB40858|nr:MULTISPECIES: ABC transporter permease subunit [unclassified Rathayibacter]MCJ1675272.1 ABC transporter permease [Rathayibacter sp. VKM Ac-2929]MCJ1684245.1 ABC transporter permease [Rathayibacter sp. VKM Ac-2928]MCJ1687060.1 ABC transporter permease [Rathayibacter sp. VKM Ac-2927]